MDIFFVSLKTSKIYGPGQVIEVTNAQEGQMKLVLNWTTQDALDEWEGYVVVVPEKVELWGVCRPEIADGKLEATFQFNSQPIPPKDRPLFRQKGQAPHLVKPKKK